TRMPWPGVCNAPLPGTGNAGTHNTLFFSSLRGGRSPTKQSLLAQVQETPVHTTPTRPKIIAPHTINPSQFRTPVTPTRPKIIVLIHHHSHHSSKTKKCCKTQKKANIGHQNANMSPKKSPKMLTYL